MFSLVVDGTTSSAPEYQHYSSDLHDAIAQQQDQLQSI
jgi:hypothetical protein